MGRQIRIFMLGSDLINLYNHIFDSKDYIIDDQGNSIKYSDLDKLDALSYYIRFQNSNIIKDSNGFLNVLKSDVIEISPCRIKNLDVDYGRLWAEFSYYNQQGIKIKKDKWFEEKYNYYIKWVKKNSLKSKCSDFYICEEALSYYKKGYHMMATPVQTVNFL